MAKSKKPHPPRADMSNIYHTEPPTEGKVLIRTSCGDIDIELWSKEAPLACRNFIQLCLEGFYDNCKIRRIIKDFMVQMGDPVGDGSNGKSIWGRPFKDEIHGRIKFNHRGQVAMANENKPNSNHTQFFVTLGACEWLDRKHTIFGKVTGNTIYNVTRMGEMEVDPNDVPVDDIFIKSVEVLWNPFEDIVPRELKKAQQQATQIIAKPERKSTNDKKLLSFGDDDDINVEVGVKAKMHSSHDSKLKSKNLRSEVADEVLSSLAAPYREDEEEAAERAKADKDKKKKAGQALQSLQSRVRDKNFDRVAEEEEEEEEEERRRSSSKRHADQLDRRAGDEERKSKKDEGDGKKMMSGEDMGAMLRTMARDDKDDKAKSRSREFAKMREELLRAKRAVKVLTGAEAEQERKDVAFQELISPLEQRRAKYTKRKHEHGDRQEDTLKKLAQFTQSLRQVKQTVKKAENTGDSSAGVGAGGRALGGGQGDGFVATHSKSAPLQSTSSASVAGGAEAAQGVAYHGQVLEQNSDDEEDDGSWKETWHVGSLKFRKHIDDAYRMGGDGRRADDYAVVDSRLATASDRDRDWDRTASASHQGKRKY